ncbi:hypothetical protein HK099_001265 [Clydaea vesicula]|uniref:F-box domain-containing protein n=1 Tax=Clydaea vesicula TaxID=447962 RepID=A0AAD5U3V9_9FUNG|nr:hypothetical protein HK099_001265 [Clydaea vesicula]KAJ3387221.1 hypothetical protein HDU92_002047 [Lobulomyces angularis]
MKSFLITLPIEILDNISILLGWEDVISLKTTSKQLYNVISLSQKQTISMVKNNNINYDKRQFLLQNINWKSKSLPNLFDNNLITDFSELGSTEGLCKLIEKNFDPTKIQNNKKPLPLIIKNGHLDVLKTLIFDGRCEESYKDFHIEQDLFLTIKNSDQDTLPKKNNFKIIKKILIESNLLNPIKFELFSTFLSSCRFNLVKLTRFLLQDDRVDPTICNSKCLSESSELGNVQIVKLLLMDGRADPTAQDYMCFRKAKANNHTAILNLLLADARVDTKKAMEHYYYYRTHRRGG